MKALITGIAGFAGVHLARHLRARGYRLCGIVQDFALSAATAQALEGVPLYRCEITDATRLAAIVQKTRPDEIYHLAAISSVPFAREHPGITFDVNIEGTRNLLHAAAALRRVRFLFVSTVQVYALPAGGKLLTEKTLLAPANAYAASKAVGEMLVRRAVQESGLRAVIVRPTNMLGPGQASKFAIGNFTRQVAEMVLRSREPVLRTGDLTRQRDFLDVRDGVRAMHLALRKGLPGETYNICSGRARSLREAVDILRRLSGMKISVRTDPAQLRTNDPARIAGSAAKLRRRTGWRPEVPFARSLADALADAVQELSGTSQN
ncbi:MAG: GDP-mannose 4,6-dehydratase [Acidobacteria bacterium]|nr:GDP-mannose 4,6-dehydratase [Acidobacteriota bacterium]